MIVQNVSTGVSPSTPIGTAIRRSTARRTMWVCSLCRRRYKTADQLVACRVEWRELGQNGRVRRSRVVADQCLQCLEADSDYNLPPLPRFVHVGSERAVQPDID